jgi:hypothetical protein
MKELKCPFHAGRQGWRCMNNCSAVILLVARFGIIRFRV